MPFKRTSPYSALSTIPPSIRLCAAAVCLLRQHFQLMSGERPRPSVNFPGDLKRIAFCLRTGERGRGDFHPCQMLRSTFRERPRVAAARARSRLLHSRKLKNAAEAEKRVTEPPSGRNVDFSPFARWVRQNALHSH